MDLAGSERPKKAGVSGRSSLIKEAGNINNSLLVLGRCMAAMRSNQRYIRSYTRSVLPSGLSVKA